MTRIASPETSAPVDAAAGAKPSEQAPTATATRRKSLSASSRGSGSVAGAAATESTAGKRGSAIAAAYGISTPAQPGQADEYGVHSVPSSADAAFSDADMPEPLASCKNKLLSALSPENVAQAAISDAPPADAD